MRAVLPKETRVLPTGGVTPETIADWRAAGADGFGIGSALYKPGVENAPEIARRARAFGRAWEGGGPDRPPTRPAWSREALGAAPPLTFPGGKAPTMTGRQAASRPGTGDQEMAEVYRVDGHDLATAASAR